MSRKGLNKTMQELYNSWEGLIKVSVRTKSERYEGCPIDEKWKTFDGFVKDNLQRYYRANRKWKNYQRVAPRGDRETGELKNKVTRFVRYKKELGFTKKNTVFTSPSDSTKFASNTHKYMFEDRLLGTRDIKNILKKRGIILTMETIVKRLKKGESLFAPSITQNVFYKNKWLNYLEIAEMENISYAMLRARRLRIDNDINTCVEYCKVFEAQRLVNKLNKMTDAEL